jgi:hypothetical protein
MSNIYAITIGSLTRFALAALLIETVAPPPASAAQPNSTLICTNLVSGVSWRITINFANRTVDSNPARISDDRVSWHDATDSGNYTLDRKSGKLTVVFASSTGGYFIYDQCRPQN